MFGHEPDASHNENGDQTGQPGEQHENGGHQYVVGEVDVHVRIANMVVWAFRVARSTLAQTRDGIAMAVRIIVEHVARHPSSGARLAETDGEGPIGIRVGGTDAAAVAANQTLWLKSIVESER